LERIFVGSEQVPEECLPFSGLAEKAASAESMITGHPPFLFISQFMALTQ
jgi:hypothetical protein